MNRKLLALDAAGGAFIAVCSCLMRRLYDLSGGRLVGVLFGAVNQSHWEAVKTLLLPYLVWAMLELLTLGLPVYHFTAAKTAGLYALGLCALSLRLCGMHGTAADCLAVCAALLISFLLFCSVLPLRTLFAPSLALLFLFVALYFSLTPFPPQAEAFRDPVSGTYGIIPPYLIDY